MTTRSTVQEGIVFVGNNAEDSDAFAHILHVTHDSDAPFRVTRISLGMSDCEALYFAIQEAFEEQSEGRGWGRRRIGRTARASDALDDATGQGRR